MFEIILFNILYAFSGNSQKSPYARFNTSKDFVGFARKIKLFSVEWSL